MDFGKCLPEVADLKERGRMPTRKLAANMATDWRRRSRMGMAAGGGCELAGGLWLSGKNKDSNYLEDPRGGCHSKSLPPVGCG